MKVRIRELRQLQSEVTRKAGWRWSTTDVAERVPKSKGKQRLVHYHNHKYKCIKHQESNQDEADLASRFKSTVKGRMGWCPSGFEVWWRSGIKVLQLFLCLSFDSKLDFCAHNDLFNGWIPYRNLWFWDRDLDWFLWKYWLVLLLWLCYKMQESPQRRNGN